MLSEKLKELRTKNGKTQNEISNSIGVSQAAYVRYEKGTAEPNVAALIKISKIYNVSIDYLVKENAEEDKNKMVEAILKDAQLRIINDVYSEENHTYIQ